MKKFIFSCIALIGIGACCRVKTSSLPITAPLLNGEAALPEIPATKNEEPPMKGGFGQTLPQEGLKKGMVMTLSPVYFDTNSAELDPLAKKKLDKIAISLKSLKANKVYLYGHCDERGSRAYNTTLGMKRVRSVTIYLHNQLNGPSYQVFSLGKDEPVCKTHTSVCWAKNRRVDISASIPYSK